MTYLFELVYLVYDVISNPTQLLHSPNSGHIDSLLVHRQNILDLSTFEGCRSVVVDSIRKDVLHLQGV